jgi:excisionase family DNA binding protein
MASTVLSHPVDPNPAVPEPQRNFWQDLAEALQTKLDRLERQRARNLGEILTPEELAERLKVPVSWVYDKQRARCKNKIPSKPMGRYVRFDWDEVVEWLEGLSNIESTGAKEDRKKSS